MSTVDTSSWNPDADLNVEIEGIPLNADAGIAQTWQALRVLMAAVKGDGGAIKAMIDVMQGATASADGASGLVPAPEAGDQDKVLKGDGTWGTVTASSVAWSDVTGKPSAFTPSSHSHGNLANDGTVGTASGKPLITGTGGAVQAGSFGTTAGTVCEGNDSRLSDARTPTSHTHGSITNDGKLGTASRAVVTDGNKAIGVSNVTATELGYLSGVTSAVQTQLNAKASDSAVVHNSGDETIAGGKTFSSCILTTSNATLRHTNASGFVQIGFAPMANGPNVNFFGKSYSSSGSAGTIDFIPRNASGTTKTLHCAPDGTLTWDGQAIQTASDERLKTYLSAVPDAVLDAWSDVQWGQFQFLDAVSAKGESARLHLGLIAQRVKAIFEARGLDACTYGILCHEVRPAKDAVFDEHGEMLFPAEDAVDLWTVRYTEALAMEVACQRRRADRLEKRLADLEARMTAMEVANV